MNSGSPILNLPGENGANGGNAPIRTSLAVNATLGWVGVDNLLEAPRVVPLTCHGHSRPVTHLHFSPMIGEDEYYIISACKGQSD